MQKYCNLNLGWRFKEGFEEEYITGGKDEEGRLVHVPHTVKEVPYDCFDQTMTCMISTYIPSFLTWRGNAPWFHLRGFPPATIYT